MRNEKTPQEREEGGGVPPNAVEGTRAKGEFHRGGGGGWGGGERGGRQRKSIMPNKWDQLAHNGHQSQNGSFKKKKNWKKAMTKGKEYENLPKFWLPLDHHFYDTLVKDRGRKI